MAEDYKGHPKPSTAQEITYDPRPSLRYATAVGLQAAGVGALVSALQNALGKHSAGAAGFFTRTGGTIGFFAAMGATFALTESVVANVRENNDALNGVAGGCAAGFLAGVRARSIPVGLASCALIGGLVGVYDYGGKSLTGVSNKETPEERRRKFFKHPPPPLKSSQPSDASE